MNSGFHDDLKDVIILDTGSTIGATFVNPKLLSDITTTRKPLEMVTNAGTKRMFKTGVIEGFGKAGFDPTQVANIFGFSKLEDQCRITYDSRVEHAFNVHTNNGIVKFTRTKDGLYVYRPSQTIWTKLLTKRLITKINMVFRKIMFHVTGRMEKVFWWILWKKTKLSESLRAQKGQENYTTPSVVLQS
jgi:hypothetical protein